MTQLSEEDIDFMMKFVENKVELFFRFPHQKLLPEQILRGRISLDFHFYCMYNLTLPLYIYIYNLTLPLCIYII